MESQRSKDDRSNGSHTYDGMRAMEARMKTLEDNHHEMRRDMGTLRLSMDDNTSALREYIDISKKLKVGLSILGVFERCAVWITKMSLAVGTMWAIWKFIIIQTITEALKR